METIGDSFRLWRSASPSSHARAGIWKEVVVEGLEGKYPICLYSKSCF
jgi:hypothetical protein